MQIFLIIWMISCKNFAILLNSSIGFSNYRHYSNIACIHDLLIKGGFNEKEIVLFQSKNASNSPKNLKKKRNLFWKKFKEIFESLDKSRRKIRSYKFNESGGGKKFKAARNR